MSAAPAAGAAAPARITLEGVAKRFVTARTSVDALGPLSLAAAEGEFVVLVGPSGCGKTTLLNLVAGFETPSAGRVLVDGAAVAGPGPDRAMIFQEPALFPWLTVLDNVAFGLRQHAHMAAAARREVAHEYLRLVHLDGFERAFVHELSGGMKQRAALARALAPQPRALLCDEPFGSLDALTRERLYAELQELHAVTRRTTLFVTHNTREAACLADRVVVLSARPARITSVLPVVLPRPRDFYDPHVSELAREILARLRGPAIGDGRDA
ncbi:MAG: ABC transporter ATP-binding protein [Acidobacteria bacterium]|nr:MAG: ABC transporter ATP-binding protein [Acidobacteriota bacterium]